MWPVKLQGSAGMDYGFCVSVYFRSRHISGINASEHGIAFVLHGPCHILLMIGSYKSEKGLTASTGQTSTAGSDVKTHPLANTEAAASLANAATVKEKLRNKMLHDAAAYGTLRMPAVLLCFSNHLPFPCVPPHAALPQTMLQALFCTYCSENTVLCRGSRWWSRYQGSGQGPPRPQARR